MKYHIIGDIHGYADELEEILKRLGYQETDGVYQQENCQVIFLGDFIDRGKKIKRVLEIAKAMTDSGHAKAVMGNHEYNAICYHTQGQNGEYLRPHNDKNYDGIKDTLEQLTTEEIEYYINWFYELPLFLEIADCRFVHACWLDENIEYLKNRLKNNCLTREIIEESATKGTELYQAVEDTLKGLEVTLPDQITIIDTDGYPRKKLRIKWYEEINNQSTYRSIALIANKELPNIPDTAIAADLLPSYQPYLEGQTVYFGHYKLITNQPYRTAEHARCLDFGIVNQGQIGVEEIFR